MTEVARDRWGRPLIVPPTGGNPVAYKRASSYGKPLDDLNNIILWKQRLTALGLVKNPHLQLTLAAAGDDRQELNAICDEAFKAAGGETKADIGTALHRLTEVHDIGDDPGFIPPQYALDIEAYKYATRDFEWLEVERFVVQDELRAAGTPDRIATFNGGTYIVDIKTGSIGFPHGFAVQLAIYANSVGYDPATGMRRPLPPVNLDRAIIIHLPAGTGQASLHWLDISKGMDAARLAAQVDSWRKTRDLTSPIDTAEETAA